MIEVIGYIGCMAFALCGLPQVIHCWKAGNAKGLSVYCLSLWMLGEVCYFISTWATFGFVLWLMLNYILNIFWLLIIFYYVMSPRHD